MARRKDSFKDLLELARRPLAFLYLQTYLRSQIQKRKKGVLFFADWTGLVSYTF